MWQPSSQRYEKMKYVRCGRSGLKLPGVSLGLWHNFGQGSRYDNAQAMLFRSCDLGITHFDLANNYGPPPGSAEETLGRILQRELNAYRDELIISTKAGYTMWEGPYGDWGSRKYVIASLDQSLRRMKLDYVDIFYHHREDPETPLQETMAALADMVRQGKALYVGISNYNAERTRQAVQILHDLGVPCLIHQFRYNLLDRRAEEGLLDALRELGVGGIAFSPLEQGILTDRYLKGIPGDSRAAGPSVFLSKEKLTEGLLSKIRALSEIAEARGQTLAQMALTWIMRQEEITSVLVGASQTAQIETCVKALEFPPLTETELQAIDSVLTQE